MASSASTYASYAAIAAGIGAGSIGVGISLGIGHGGWLMDWEVRAGLILNGRDCVCIVGLIAMLDSFDTAETTLAELEHAKVCRDYGVEQADERQVLSHRQGAFQALRTECLLEDVSPRTGTSELVRQLDGLTAMKRKGKKEEIKRCKGFSSSSRFRN